MKNSQSKPDLKKYFTKRKELQNQIEKLKREIKSLDAQYVELMTLQKKL